MKLSTKLAPYAEVLKQSAVTVTKRVRSVTGKAPLLTTLMLVALAVVVTSLTAALIGGNGRSSNTPGSSLRPVSVTKARAKAAPGAAATGKATAAATREKRLRDAQKLGLTREQAINARTIVWAGQKMGVPPRGQIIAVATAMQESNLHNFGYLGVNNDYDSLGLFQQRPSSGWGTPAQVTNPLYSARAFYRALIGIPGWQRMPLTAAAQAVQISAYPDRYADDERLATRVVWAVD